MWEFIKRIFSEREGDVTVVVLDEHNPDGSSSFKLRARDIIKMVVVVILLSVLFTTILFFATPIGSLYQFKEDYALRQNVVEISERVMSLQDSLIARDTQLNDMKEILRTAADTTLAVEQSVSALISDENYPVGGSVPNVQTFEMLSQNEIIFSGSLNKTPDFPSDFPVEGSMTQGYNAEDGHYGIDIAAGTGTIFKAVADGTVMNAGWTINYGYVIYLQHAGGVVSVYKHGARLARSKGDFVLKGDILGEIGDRGVLSTGSHLHLEIWKNGVPQNPLMYLNN
ncbi:M23 family metallopeptidase [Rhodohalobacter sp.]|uniref:M23 family metallopeptidase n=1 Tax=Rhodohalobacter sp. TaxID=1974210 RepID=UPI002ACE27E5|nr:M23 family metallopeptidase [Rhodohalobacter sp.]MDZ7755315.1 M23 family metallopeptidase [Rhodohalobacter sp.]